MADKQLVEKMNFLIYFVSEVVLLLKCIVAACVCTVVTNMYAVVRNG